MRSFLRNTLCCLSALVLAASLGACGRAGLPDPSSQDYADAVAAYYSGLAGIETGAHRQAEQYLIRVTELAPEEPAAWANLGLLALRENRLDDARGHLERARELAPDNGRIYLLLGMLAQREGRIQEAVDHLRRSAELNPGDLRAAYALLRAIEREPGEAGRGEVAQLLDRMREVEPDNLAVLLEQARLGAQLGDADMLERAAAELADRAGAWPEEIQELLRFVQQAGRAGDFQRAISRMALLQNDLQRLSAFRDDLAAVRDSEGQEGAPFTHFLRLPPPDNAPAVPDTLLRFTTTSLSIDGGPWQWVGTLPLAGNRVLTLAVANGRTVKLGTGTSFPFPGGSAATPPGRHGVVAVDYDNDYQMDLVLAGAGGVRFLRQEGTNAFADVTAETGLPADVVRGAYAGVWAADLDQEGDLDLILASRGATRVLRNNGDGTFTVWPLFGDVAGLEDVVTADLDADGDLDVALLDGEGTVHLYENHRFGQFGRVAMLPHAEDVRAVAAADLDGDSRMELLTLSADGVVRRLAAPESAGRWETVVVARWNDRPAGLSQLVVADLDNNGGLDVLAAGPTGGRIWLSSADGSLVPIDAPPGPRLFDVADLSGAGRLDLIGLSEDGQPLHRVNEGPANYASKSIQVQAARTTGDRRINSYGVGGTVEIRAGLLYQKQRITSPVVRFGLGNQPMVHVARIIWPNGSMQAEFDLETDQVVLAQQRLKGSCPWVFTHDGDEMRFVTDFLWRTALGLRINAQEGTNVMHGVDWIKIDADQLKPRDGLYDVRITAELWETHFFDHVALMTVDHPREIEVFIDERFAVPAPEWELHPMGSVHPVQQAWDDRGRDVTELVRALDGRYLDTFELGAYQGVAREHHVEVDLGAAPRSGPLWIVASGWVRPTDSSINYAMAQGAQEPPRGLSLDVPDERGGWKTARSDVGFPAGKTKTILLDVEDLFEAGVLRRLRLRTSMEIYWDRIAWAVGRPDAEIRTQRLAADSAVLRYRGFSTVSQAGHSSPELPEYGRLAATGPQWRDLIGYHTRFGDVRPLLAEIDDRYVIMNAGDELALQFPVPPLPEGWVRDFVLIGDGWVKDGDYNTGHSKTVRPLPYHGLTDYSDPPARLTDERAYRRHPRDWRDYHTRYVTPENFQRALTTSPRSR